jgi:hypothetical protein
MCHKQNVIQTSPGINVPNSLAINVVNKTKNPLVTTESARLRRDCEYNASNSDPTPNMEIAVISNGIGDPNWRATTANTGGDENRPTEATNRFRPRLAKAKRSAKARIDKSSAVHQTVDSIERRSHQIPPSPIKAKTVDSIDRRRSSSRSTRLSDISSCPLESTVRSGSDGDISKLLPKANKLIVKRFVTANRDSTRGTTCAASHVRIDNSHGNIGNVPGIVATDFDFRPPGIDTRRGDDATICRYICQRIQQVTPSQATNGLPNRFFADRYARWNVRTMKVAKNARRHTYPSRQ